MFNGDIHFLNRSDRFDQPQLLKLKSLKVNCLKITPQNSAVILANSMYNLWAYLAISRKGIKKRISS